MDRLFGRSMSKVIVKLDIKGAEYGVIQSIVDDSLNIRVFCVEYDGSGPIWTPNKSNGLWKIA